MEVLLDDYPYAEDGLLIWDALQKWNDGYLVGGVARAAASNTREGDVLRRLQPSFGGSSVLCTSSYGTSAIERVAHAGREDLLAVPGVCCPAAMG